MVFLKNTVKAMWDRERKERERKAVEMHAEMHRLFIEDRLAFERKRKRMIDELINSAEDEERRNALRSLQASWDKKMKGAGSGHNRFILAQTLFYEHVNEKFLPALRGLRLSP